MVEDVEVHGRRCKLLYLTNKQAMELKLEPIEKFVQAMEISPRPKLVMHLFTSIGICTAGAHYDKMWAHFNDAELAGGMCSELDGRAGLDELDRRLAMFIRQCIIPVAIRASRPNPLVHCLRDRLSSGWL
mmetsp:Transcript_69775/g.209566  ORF Transcript_69775/g.209566 Transcript_69775/m.209566 type:complete len:130 (+) Transcript_69775:530-919(+)